MDWGLLPALLAASVMMIFGLGAVFRPSVLARIGVTATSPLGRSEIRAVFGGMFIALGLACIVLREPLVFGVVGAAWLTDAALRGVAVVVDRVPPKEAAAVLAIALVMGGTLLSGYWLA